MSNGPRNGPRVNRLANSRREQNREYKFQAVNDDRQKKKSSIERDSQRSSVAVLNLWLYLHYSADWHNQSSISRPVIIRKSGTGTRAPLG